MLFLTNQQQETWWSIDYYKINMEKKKGNESDLNFLYIYTEEEWKQPCARILYMGYITSCLKFNTVMKQTDKMGS